MIEYLGRDDIFFLLRLSLKRHGGAYDFLKPDILDYAVDAPKMSSFDQELYPRWCYSELGHFATIIRPLKSHNLDGFFAPEWARQNMGY